MGKLIIIEGLDGCGKSTQTALLEKYFEDNSVKFKKIKLPDYDSKSSTLVKMYLGGEFGKNADDVNAYAAGAFYAVDRFASYKLDWGKDYENGTLILADRYATSNSIYQMEKIDEDKWDEYRYIHSLGVMEMAEELAKVYNVDVESARIAGLLHDIAKEMTKEESLEYVEKNNIAIDEVEKADDFSL